MRFIVVNYLIQAVDMEETSKSTWLEGYKSGVRTVTGLYIDGDSHPCYNPRLVNRSMGYINSSGLTMLGRPRMQDSVWRWARGVESDSPDITDYAWSLKASWCLPTFNRPAHCHHCHCSSATTWHITGGAASSKDHSSWAFVLYIISNIS